VSATALLLATLLSTSADTAPIECSQCPAWNEARAPFRLHGDSWYVGTQGLSAVLIAGSDGLVLIDGALPQSAPLIAANIEALGFSLQDIRWILNSHAHFDHAGGIAALQRLSGARVGARARGAEALRMGNTSPDDPQAGYGREANAFPPVADVVVLETGQVLQVGDIALTLHPSDGHTPGGATWTWRSCDADGDCRNLVFADSLTAVSAPDFRFSRDPARVTQFRATIAAAAALDCDLLVSAHPGFSGLFEKLAQREAGSGENSLIDPQACARYAEGGGAWLDKRLTEEAGS
jgi:metallo-beta-lactamase class B